MSQTSCACGKERPVAGLAGWSYDINIDKFWCPDCMAWMARDLDGFKKWRAASKEIQPVG